MPDLDIHCKISKTRTGNEFKELHEWMDEPKAYLGYNHRIERHSFHEGYKEFIEKKWGSKAVVEWLFHIAIDNLETANKFAFDAYNKIFEEISISFEEKNLSGCRFVKKFPNSNKVFEFDLSGKVEEKKGFGETINKEEEEPLYTKEELMLMGFDEILAEQMELAFREKRKSL